MARAVQRSDSRGAGDSAKKVLFGIFSIIIAILIIWGGVTFAKWVPSVGESVTSTPIAAPSWVNDVLRIGLGIGGENDITWENVILHLAIFMILFFALSDIVSMFSSFSETTSWIIGLGLALIAGVTRVITAIAGMMGLTAGIGALGIMIIVVASIAAAVALNLGLGGAIRRW